MTTPLSSMSINPEANSSERSRKELQDKLNGLGGINGRKLDPEAKAKKLREACEGFESIFIQKMWQEMRNAVPKGGLLQGKEEKFWQDMYDQELSKSMTRAGGIGLADMMYEQLSRNLVSASRTAAGMGSASPFTPAAAPLVGSGTEELSPLADEMNPDAHVSSASIYEGEAPQAAVAQVPTPAPLAEAPYEAEPAQENASVHEVAQPAAPAAAPVTNAVNQAHAAEINQAADKNAARKIEAAERREARRARHKKTENSKSHYEDNGLNLAYLAKREAGDKLGSGAVRPALHARREHAEISAEPVQNASSLITQAGQLIPGSTAGLQAALDMARSGQQNAEPGNFNLQNIVAQVQAGNATAEIKAAEKTSEAAPTEPVTRKIRYTTNIPKSGNSRKKTDSPIRTLNVDNVGVNSKQGQGIAAFHEAQASQAAQTVQSEAVQASAPIAPLTASAVKEPEANSVNYTVPPLRANGVQG